MRFGRRLVLAVMVLAAFSSSAFGQYGVGFMGGTGPLGGVGMGLYGVPEGDWGNRARYPGGFGGTSLFNFGGAGLGPYGFGYDIGPTDRNLFGGSNYGRGSGLGYDFSSPRGGMYFAPTHALYGGYAPAPVAAPAPYLTNQTYEPGDGHRYPLYYDPVNRRYVYYPVGR